MGPVTARRPGIADCLTLGNAMCGLAAIVAVTGLGPFAAAEPADRYRVAALLIIAGTVLDMVDGMAARRWGGTPLGPLLDGLADGVTFGVAPVVAVLAVPSTATSAAEWATLAAGGGVYAIAALVRLADYAATRSSERGFRGLPTTSASIAALALGVLTTSPTVLAIGLAVLGALMLSSMAYPGGARFVAFLLPAWAVGVCALFGLVDVRVCAVLVLVVLCLVVPLSTRVRGAASTGRHP